MKNKKEEVMNLIDQADPSIIMGTETWLNPLICSAEIFFPIMKSLEKTDMMGMVEFY